jgi:hypothetical protein
MGAVLTLLLCLPLDARQDAKKAEQARIDAAISKGVYFLRSAESTGYAGQQITDCDERLGKLRSDPFPEEGNATAAGRRLRGPVSSQVVGAASVE